MRSRTPYSKYDIQAHTLANRIYGKGPYYQGRHHWKRYNKCLNAILKYDGDIDKAEEFIMEDISCFHCGLLNTECKCDELEPNFCKYCNREFKGKHYFSYAIHQAVCRYESKIVDEIIEEIEGKK